MLAFPEMLVFGEDTARKGGVYGVTQGLQKRLDPPRVFDTLLDETSILGLAQGLATRASSPSRRSSTRLRPQRLDQLRARPALSPSLRRAVHEPMVVRIQGLAYQKGSAATSTTTTRSVRCATSRA